MVKMTACDISIQKNLFDCLALHGAVTAYDIVIRTYNLVTLESHYEAKMRIHFMAIGHRENYSVSENRLATQCQSLSGCCIGSDF